MEQMSQSDGSGNDKFYFELMRETNLQHQLKEFRGDANSENFTIEEESRSTLFQEQDSLIHEGNGYRQTVGIKDLKEINKGPGVRQSLSMMERNKSPNKDIFFEDQSMIQGDDDNIDSVNQ